MVRHLDSPLRVTLSKEFLSVKLVDTQNIRYGGFKFIELFVKAADPITEYIL